MPPKALAKTKAGSLQVGGGTGVVNVSQLKPDIPLLHTERTHTLYVVPGVRPLARITGVVVLVSEGAGGIAGKTAMP